MSNELDIIKPKSDTYSYSYETLPNGLKCMCVHDPKADKNSASLSVGVGCLIDPSDLKGLAHFCEHMLFMGTEKYPDENLFEKRLNENGGMNNAFTSTTITNYYFDCSIESFPEILDMFAQFFIAPLFKKDSVDREIHAVDSENTKNLLNDSWREYQLLLSEANPKSAFHTFSTGNLSTLNKPTVRDELISMHKKYYSSDGMCLSIYSNLTLKESSDLVKKLFSEVPKIPNFIRPTFDDIPAYDESNLQFFYKIVPIKNKDSISFKWYLENDLKYYKEKPNEILTSLFGHEGPNSLCSSLTKDDLITELLTHKQRYGDAFVIFGLDVTLTQKGLAMYKDVIARILKFIRIIQEQEINESFCNEIKIIRQFNWDYVNKREPMFTLLALTNGMFSYPPREILKAEDVIDTIDKDLIRKCLNALKLNNLNIYFSSQSLKDQCDLTEKWYGTKYHKQPLSEVITENDITSHICEHPLGYPPENTFIPKNFDIIEWNEKEDTEYPVEIYKDDICSIYYKKDNFFKLPKVCCKAIISLDTKALEVSPLQKRIINLFWKHIVKYELMEIKYMADEAKASINIKQKEHCIKITLKGFNDSIQQTLTTICKIFHNIIYDNYKDKMKIFQNSIYQKEQNFFHKIQYRVIFKYLSKIMQYPLANRQEIVNALNKENEINYDLISSYVESIFKKFKIDLLIQGNISKQDAINLGKTFQNNVKTKPVSLDINNIFTKRAVKLNPKENIVFTLDNPKETEKDSAIISFYQFGKLDNKSECILLLLEKMLNERFFDEIRTKQALGYIAFLGIKNIRGNQGVYCLIQSNEVVPEVAWQRINEFMTKAKKEVIDVLTQESLNTFIKSVLVDLKKKDNNLNQEIKFNFKEVKRHTYQFDRKKQKAAILENGEVSVKDVQESFDKFLINDISRLDIEYVCKDQKEENEKVMKENIALCEKEGNVKRIRTTNPHEIANRSSLYPDFYTLGM